MWCTSYNAIDERFVYFIESPFELDATNRAIELYKYVVMEKGSSVGNIRVNNRLA